VDGCADIEQALKTMTDYLELVDVIVRGTITSCWCLGTGCNV